jgi:hypothetical protein
MDQPVNRRRAVTALVAAALGAGLVWVLPGALPGAGAQDEASSMTSTSVVGGNPDCGDLVTAAFEFRIEVGNDLPDETTYTDPATGFEVAIFDVEVVGGTAFFSFESNIPVSAVFVKAGPGGILYTFDPPSTIGIDLASPMDSVSHISFCWNTPPPPPTTTPTTPPTTTPTTPPTAPTSTSTTTTTETSSTTTPTSTSTTISSPSTTG